MDIKKLSPLFLSIAALGLWACGGSSGTGTTGTGGTTTGGTTTGGTSGSNSGGDAGPPGLGMACTQGATSDPCLIHGLACTKSSDGTSSSCQLPGELSPCLDAGCATTIPPLSCDPGFMQSGVPVNLCVYHCNFTSQCPNPLTNCQNSSPQFCFYDFCGPGAPIANGTTYLAPCNNGGTANGTCMPLLGLSSPGICQASGPVALWQPCSDTRPDGGTSQLCTVGADCVMFPSATPGQPASTLCAPLCAPAGSGLSGPSCATGETCLSAGPMVSFGNCLIDCSGGQACPSPTHCGGLNVSGQTVQVCLP